MKKFLALSLSGVVFIMLINVKMQTIVGILTFINMINLLLSWVEPGESFITSGPVDVLFLFSNKMVVIKAGMFKMLVRIANQDYPDQTASLEAVWSGSALFV